MFTHLRENWYEKNQLDNGRTVSHCYALILDRSVLCYFKEMKESKIQTIFNQYLREKRWHGFFELKVAKADVFYLSQIEEHQLEGLQAVEKNGLVWKLSDEDRRRKPCDTLCIPPLPAFVVVAFGSSFYCIRIQKILDLIKIGETKISLKNAGKYSEKVIHI